LGRVLLSLNSLNSQIGSFPGIDLFDEVTMAFCLQALGRTFWPITKLRRLIVRTSFVFAAGTHLRQVEVLQARWLGSMTIQFGACLLSCFSLSRERVEDLNR
jgi:hypothetical protein